MKQSMHIALFIYSLVPGGAQRSMANLANYWVDRGYQVSVITVDQRGTDFYALSSKVRRIDLCLGYRRRRSVLGAALDQCRRVWHLRRALKRVGPSVVVSYMTTSNVLLGLASMFSPWVAIGSERTWPARWAGTSLWRVLRAVAYARLFAVTASTPDTAKWIRDNTSAPRVRVIPNPIWPIPSNDPTLLLADHLDRSDKLLLAVGRLQKVKGFDVLLDAFAIISARYPDWKLVILGSGSERDALLEQSASLGIEHRVTLPGAAGNMEDWYRRAQLYVMTSRFEGFGNSLAEAMACGVAVLSVDCPVGPRHIVENGRSGVLVPAGNQNALVSELERLMSCPEDRAALSNEALAVRERFSVRAVARQWEELFAEGLDRASP